eukprot:CAMPEP_0179435306 /NCGR_PEP_ID=MMETSP0799-20121207/19455_1 /TAXON_ID=46947 /ORGANISM="Geminigera cryophila, Strain CCMP2564" /LENGTH=591 /DNA_ID=CAMNT_0021214623 /DNA_START=18 /DNA_END=1793 /DNA_ORIENTATION=+
MARGSLSVLTIVTIAAAVLPAAQGMKIVQGLREQASDIRLPPSASAACLKADTPVTLVDPPCPIEVSAQQVCPFEQVRLAAGLWDDKDGQWWMSVSWATTNETAGSSQPMVRMANTQGALEGNEVGCVLLFSGTSTSYSYVSAGGPYFSEATKYYISPIIHHTDIGPLQPSTVYYYQVGKSAADGEPELYRDTVFQFRTPPAPGAMPSKENWKAGSTKTGETMTIVMVGDIGQTYNSNRTACTIKDRWKTDPSVAAGIIIGDMAYADGDGNRWDTWGRLMEQTFAQLPLMVVPGNHEIDYDAETSMAFAPYRARFRMPSKLPEKIAPLTGGDFLYEGGSSYYSFSVGLVHFVMINNYNTHSAMLDPATDPQRMFVEQDLAKVDRKKTPFVIACMHNPMYNSNMGHHHEATTIITRKWAEPLFLKYGVDAVFSGHVHAYERNGGVAYGKPSASGPIYVTVGDGGNHEGLYDEWLPKPDYSVFRDGRYYGHGELKIYNHSHIKWTWVPNVEQGTDLPIDETWIRPRTSATNLLTQQTVPIIPQPAAGSRLMSLAVPVGVTVLATMGMAGLAMKKFYTPSFGVREPLLPNGNPV